jgi:hypothetical protein
MMTSDALSIAASIVAAFGGGAVLVFALSSWLGKVWANRLMEGDKARHAIDLKALESDLSRVAEDRTRKLDSLKRHYERQVEEFYGPLFNMVHQVFVANHVQGEILKGINPEESDKVSNYFHATYFDPMHEEIRQILRTKLYLVDGSGMPASFYLYLKHAAQERDQRTLWKQHGINTNFLDGEPWPDNFYTDIRRGFESAMKNYESCLEGLKASS